MELEHEILINKYGQSLVEKNVLCDCFAVLGLQEKKDVLIDVVYLIMQSKAVNEDVDNAIKNSGLKQSFTPCVLLKKGVDTQNLMRIIELPINELNKVFELLITLFKIAYQRRFKEERNQENKWWYWDLSNEARIKYIRERYK